MKRVIRFTRLRFVMMGLSAALIVTGIVTFAVKGFNLGIDFRGGMTQQIQFAPVAMVLSGSGSDKIEVSSHTGQVSLASGQSLDITVTKGTEATTVAFSYAEYPTIGELAAALSAVPGVSAKVIGAASLPSARLFVLEAPAVITATPLVMNYPLAVGDAPIATVSSVRAALTGLGQYEVQTLGTTESQQFMLKMGVPAGDQGEFRQSIEGTVKSLLGKAFDPQTVLIRKTDYVGPKMAGELVTQTISVIAVSLVLMLVYLSLRFEFAFAVAAVLCIMQDSAVMITFVLLSGMEMSTSVIAAILTIIGYSVNDTIVIFDRVRENKGLMRDAEDTILFDTSITVTLSRTVITSFVTLLSVVALFIYSSGSLKDFALLMIVGVVEGTWSTIYIASPIVLWWHSLAKRRQKHRDAKRFGSPVAKVDAGERTVVEASEETDGQGEEAGSTEPELAKASGDVIPKGAEGTGPVVRLQPSRKKKKKR